MAAIGVGRGEGGKREGRGRGEGGKREGRGRGEGGKREGRGRGEGGKREGRGREGVRGQNEVFGRTVGQGTGSLAFNESTT